MPLDEAAVLVGVSQRTLTRWVKAGTLPYVRSGQAGKLWFRRSDLQAFQQVD